MEENPYLKVRNTKVLDEVKVALKVNYLGLCDCEDCLGQLFIFAQAIRKDEQQRIAEDIYTTIVLQQGRKEDAVLLKCQNCGASCKYQEIDSNLAACENC